MQIKYEIVSLYFSEKCKFNFLFSKKKLHFKKNRKFNKDTDKKFNKWIFMLSGSREKSIGKFVF